MSRRIRTRRSSVVLAAALAALAPRAVVAQSVDHVIPLEDSDPGNVPDSPFGIRLTPDGLFALVAIAGEVGGSNNHLVDVIELGTETVVNRLEVGNFPTDVAFTLDGAGDVRHVFVANSTDGTVSVFDSIFAGAAVATVPLGGFSFPFGVVASPDGDRVYVGSLGNGDVYVIDADPLSGTFATVVDTFNVPSGVGRMAFAGPDTLVITHTVFALDFSKGDAYVTVLDPANPADRDTTLLVLGRPGQFASGQDVAVTEDGIAWITVFDSDRLLYALDAATRDVVATIDLGPLAENLQHGIEIAPDGRLAIVTNFVNETISVIDLVTETVIADVVTDAEPNEVAFSKDGFTAYVTCQNGGTVNVIRELPPGRLRLTGPGSPSLGESIAYTLSGGERAEAHDFLFSAFGRGSAVFDGTTTGLRAPLKRFATGVFDLDGVTPSISRTVPNKPALVGRKVWFQGRAFYDDGSVRTSNVLTAVVQP